jgi:hypothetical protein
MWNVNLCVPKKIDFWPIFSVKILGDVKHPLAKMFLFLCNKILPLLHFSIFYILHCHGGRKDSDNNKDHMQGWQFFPHNFSYLPRVETSSPMLQFGVWQVFFIALVEWFTRKRRWWGRVLTKPTIGHHDAICMPFARCAKNVLRSII